MNNKVTSDKSSATWVGIDWGTTNIRAYLLDASARILDKHTLARHIKDCNDDGWTTVYQTLIEGWNVTDETPVIICGMAGSKFGWVEAPYASCPAGVSDLVAKAVHPDDIENIMILPGLCCKDDRGNHDVIRGEETQLLGLFEQSSLITRLICAPGTHTKWISADNYTVRNFHTTMTGELFGLLTEHSILAQSIAKSSSSAVGAKFEDGVRMAAEGGGLLADIFKVRANSLFNELNPEDAGDFLSGILVGTDVFQEVSSLDHGLVSVPLIGPKPLSERYARALSHFGIEGIVLDAEELTIAGLASVARQMGIVETSHVA
ncbi:2-dehydro-3-deoxygalactonokinase [Cohaesibacter sp. ES.047]|uniref:2-dehydro-3-deoxygalactonokinase n=1 Tax=Cohaesibacter sp. ES.047 TaxID=1798205 RepID=UPI000BBFD136|nr:2-dehydro-3-deoxygalactonokinase [Cohaesibacter sp. ES.047]SNY89980.1 2-dehydro-3-deoxygalactonokinase [Cohaesibacter sp. ES.047]